MNIQNTWDQRRIPITCPYKQSRLLLKRINFSPPHKVARFQKPGNYCLWNPEFQTLGSGIQLGESGIPQTILIRNPLSRIRNPQRKILNPRLSWITLNGAKLHIAGWKNKDNLLVRAQQWSSNQPHAAVGLVRHLFTVLEFLRNRIYKADYLSIEGCHANFAVAVNK